MVSLVTKPKPAEQLRGLVYSETPKEMRTDPERGVGTRGTAAPSPWPALSLAMVIALNLVF